MRAAAVAVLDQEPQLGQLLYRPEHHRTRVQREPSSMAELFHLADAADTYQLWLTRRWCESHPVADLARLEGWAIARTDDARGSVAIVAPSLDARRRLAGLADADGCALLGAITEFEAALETHYLASPGYVAESMLRANLRRRGLHVAADMPEILTTRTLEGAVSWLRPLLPDERARRLCVAVDKHAAYLVAMGRVELGIGAVEHQERPVFDAHTPGVWHVRTRELGGLLFDPTGDRRRDGWRWLTTPSVRAADELGMLAELDDAYIWPQHSRVLELWAQRIRTARTRLLARADQEATRRALWLLKRVYTSMVGRLRLRREDPLYRPDWYDALVAEARVSLWHNAVAAAELPFAAEVDCLYFAVDRAAVPDGLRQGADAGQFELKAAVPLRQVQDARTPAELARAVRAAARG